MLFRSYIGVSLPSSELKILPVIEMKNSNQKTPKTKIKSLSNLPISTKNLIRKISGNPFDNYRLLKKLGNGTFGQVYKVMQIKTGNIRAMKIIPEENVLQGEGASLIDEIEILSSSYINDIILFPSD